MGGVDPGIEYAHGDAGARVAQGVGVRRADPFETQLTPVFLGFPLRRILPVGGARHGHQGREGKGDQRPVQTKAHHDPPENPGRVPSEG